MGTDTPLAGPLTAMILDDEPIVGRRLKPALEKLGIEVEVFEDSLAACDRLDGKAFDIIVSDVKMKGMDGMQLLERVRASGARTKVILITGYPSEELMREALAKGAFELLAKPFKTANLRAVIDRAARALGHPGLAAAGGE